MKQKIKLTNTNTITNTEAVWLGVVVDRLVDSSTQKHLHFH